MWLSWGFGVMAENTQNVHASSLASSGKRVSCCVSSPGLWCELGSHSGPRPPAVQTEPLGHGWCLPSVFCACCFVLFPLQPGNVTLCRPGGSWFNSKEEDLAESVRMAEIPEMFQVWAAPDCERGFTKVANKHCVCICLQRPEKLDCCFSLQIQF